MHILITANYKVRSSTASETNDIPSKCLLTFVDFSCFHTFYYTSCVTQTHTYSHDDTYTHAHVCSAVGMCIDAKREYDSRFSFEGIGYFSLRCDMEVISIWKMVYPIHCTIIIILYKILSCVFHQNLPSSWFINLMRSLFSSCLHDQHDQIW